MLPFWLFLKILLLSPLPPPLSLIHTGTGKSETGAHIAYIFAQQLEEKQCVVYCAPSNKAVDVVHGELCVFRHYNAV